MQVHLTAKDLGCRRGERVLFRGLSLALGPGEALQVTGANGTGKSSLLRQLAGLLSPFTGTVARTGSVGLVDEHHALDQDIALGHALRFWAGLDGIPTVDLEHAAERLALAPLLDVPVRYLSTGQRKRAALARLLGQDAAIWLLDEPLNGLDTAGGDLLAQLVGEHRAAGGLVVLASHQPFPTAIPALALADYAP